MTTKTVRELTFGGRNRVTEDDVLREASIVRAYRKAHRLHHPDTYLPPFSMREKGQLGHMRRRYGFAANRVVNRTLKDWKGFVDSIKDGDDKAKVPAHPKVGFLLKHLDWAASR